MIADLPSHGQALLLALLRDREASGRELRAALAARAYPLRGPAFYQFMDRLERLDYVAGRYEDNEDKGTRVRLWRITAAGRAALQKSIDCYKNLEEMAS
jgi:DNA-binding PadR family transcriptional regulator